MITCNNTLLCTHSSCSGNSSGNFSRHPPYILHLALSDFHLFLHLKTFLASQNFTDSEQLKSMVENTQVAAFFDEGIQKLVPHYDQCFYSSSKYVEK
jgi:hypothetical protein